MKQKIFNKKNQVDYENDSQIISTQKLYLYSEEDDKILNQKDNEKSLYQRGDWDIRKGDFIIDPPKLKRKFFRKQDLQNFISDFWYILLSLLITYLIMYFLTKII